MKTHIIVFIISLFSCFTLSAGDVTGAKDPMGLKRYEGTRITYYDQKAHDTYDLPLGLMTKIDFDTHKGEFEKSLKLEGKVTRVSYASSDLHHTSLEVYRKYKSELKAQGWETLWEGSEAELSNGNGDAFAHLFHDRPGQTFEYSFLGGHFIAAKKGNAHLALYIVSFKDGYVGKEELAPTKGAPIVALDIIESASDGRKNGAGEGRGDGF